MSLIENVNSDVIVPQDEIWEDIIKKQIKIIVKFKKPDFEKFKIFIKKPRLFDNKNNEIFLTDNFSSPDIAAYTFNEIVFKFELCNKELLLEDGFKFIIEYKYDNQKYIKEIYLYRNNVWMEENDKV